VSKIIHELQPCKIKEAIPSIEEMPMSASKALQTDSIPILEPGDRLSRDEFERRYAAMPHVKKAELIEGVVYMPSPVRFSHHAEPHSHLIYWMCHYKVHTPCVLLADNGTDRLDENNEPQPDGMLFLDPACGGRTRISIDDYVEGAPELVAEVSSSSVSFDLHTKKDVYCRNDVHEYVVWRVLDRHIDWFVNRDGSFEHLEPDAGVIVRSKVFPGLWLDTSAMLKGDLARVLAVLQQGLASPEHAEFLGKHKRG
jgi:Uma2 family endonuclease